MCILFFVILKTMALLKCGFVQSIIIKKFGLRGKYVELVTQLQGVCAMFE